MSSRSLSNILVFVGSFLILAMLVSPDNTWINTNSDGSTYIAAAKYFRLSHPTGAPLFNELNWILSRVTPGSDYWSLAIWSAVWSAGTATLLWLLTRRIVAPLIFLGAGLVVSQSTIIETYPFITFLMVLAYWCHKREHHAWKYVVCGLGIAVHHLIGLVFLPLVVSDYLKYRTFNWNILWILVGIPFYAYLPLANREPYHWIPGNSVGDYFRYFTSQGGFIGGLAVWPPDNLIMRVYDLSVVLFGGLALASTLVVISIWKKWKRLEVWLFLGPIIYFASTIPPQAYVYMMPSMAFGAILATEYIDWNSWYKHALYNSLVLLLILNLVTYDVGRTLDPKLTATQFYNDLDMIPDGATVFTNDRGWETATLWLYQYDHDNRINVTPRSWTTVQAQGQVESLKKAQVERSLWQTVVVKPETYEVRIEKWNPSFDAICEAIFLGNTLTFDDASSIPGCGGE